MCAIFLAGVGRACHAGTSYMCTVAWPSQAGPASDKFLCACQWEVQPDPYVRQQRNDHFLVHMFRRAYATKPPFRTQLQLERAKMQTMLKAMRALKKAPIVDTSRRAKAVLNMTHELLLRELLHAKEKEQDLLLAERRAQQYKPREMGKIESAIARKLEHVHHRMWARKDE